MSKPDITALPTPAALASELSFVFTRDQAEAIAAEVYQPLLTIIEHLVQEQEK